MIKLVGYSNTPLTSETPEQKVIEGNNLYIKYKMQGKIIGDYILLKDNAVQFTFRDLTSAEAFKQESLALYAKYNDTVTFEYVD